MVRMRYEVSVNGVQQCIAGVDAGTPLSQNITFAPIDDRNSYDTKSVIKNLQDKKNNVPINKKIKAILSVGGSTENSILLWLNRNINIGDEVTVRILGPGPCTPPIRSMSVENWDDPSNKTRDISLTNILISNGIDAWNGRTSYTISEDVEHECGLHIRAGNISGPSLMQIQFLEKMVKQYADLWNDVKLAIQKHVPEKTISDDDFNKYLSLASMTINKLVNNEEPEAELVYSCSKTQNNIIAYIVKIQNWEVCDIVSVK
jgi:hypothetical protein